jgi:hypothetical protein
VRHDGHDGELPDPLPSLPQPVWPLVELVLVLALGPGLEKMI